MHDLIERRSTNHYESSWGRRNFFGITPGNLTEDFGMRRVSVKFVPWLLTVEQRSTVYLRTMICYNMQNQTKVLQKHCNRWLNCVWLQPRNSTTTDTIENIFINTPQETAPSLMQDTGHAYRFLGIVRQLTRPNSKPLLLFNSTHTSPRCIST